MDFDILIQRNRMYRDLEQQSLEQFKCASDEQVQALRESNAAAAVK